MFALMFAIYPYIAVCNIVNLAFISDVSWSSIFSVILFQFFKRKFSFVAFQSNTTNKVEETKYLKIADRVYEII